MPPSTQLTPLSDISPNSNPLHLTLPHVDIDNDDDTEAEAEMQRGRKRRRSSATSPTTFKLPSNNIRGRGRVRSTSRISHSLSRSDSSKFLSPSRNEMISQGSERDKVRHDKNLTVKEPSRKYQKTIIKDKRRNQSPSRSRNGEMGQSTPQPRRRRTRSRTRERDDPPLKADMIAEKMGENIWEDANNIDAINRVTAKKK